MSGCERCHGSGYVEECKTDVLCPECDGSGDSPGQQIADLREEVRQLKERCVGKPAG